MARREYEQMAAHMRRMGLMAVAVIVVVAGLLWIGMYGTSKLVERRLAEREAEVVRTLRTIGDALTTYQQRFGGYPDSLARLAGKEAGQVPNFRSYLPPERARLLESALARDQFEQDGYVITYSPTGAGQTWAATVPLVGGYVLEARPTGQATSRMAFYYADQTRAVRIRRGAPAGPEDPLAPFTP